MEIQKSTLQIVAVIGISLLLVVGFLIITSNRNDGNTTETTDQAVNTTFKTVDVETFANEIERENAMILDIRTPEEFEQGRIEGSVNIDFYAPDFKTQLSKLDKKAEYKIYCNSGNRSGITMQMMKDMNFINVIELDGGIQAWVAADSQICTEC